MCHAERTRPARVPPTPPTSSPAAQAPLLQGKHLHFGEQAPKPRFVSSCKWFHPLAIVDWTGARHVTQAGPINFSPGLRGGARFPSLQLWTLMALPWGQAGGMGLARGGA